MVTETPATSPTPPTGRLLSIDALRGFDMFWIVGGDRLVHAIARWQNSDVSRTVATQFEHVDWEGFRFYDLIFPLFLFLVGAVLPFSLGKIPDTDRRAAYWRIARRTAFLFGLGLIFNDVLQFRWDDLRVAGVLQRIALCYGIAAVITLNTSVRGRVIVLAAILLGYWALLENVAPPGGVAGDLSKEGNLSGWVDRNVLPGRILRQYYGYGDNEGILSTIPAVGTALLGVLAGGWLRSTRRPWTKVASLAVAGGVCLGVGFFWGQSFPIIKNLWTSSFVLVAGGWSLLLLALFYAVIDVIGWQRWAFPFAVIGANAITIYFARAFIDFNDIAQFFLGGVYYMAEVHVSSEFRGVAMAVGVLLVEWLLLLFLYRRRIFLRV